MNDGRHAPVLARRVDRTPSRPRLLLGLAVLVLIGVGSKVWHGPGEEFCRAWVGGAAYVVFWTWFVLLLAPGVAPGPVALRVLLFTAAIECSQLWHPLWLNRWRSNVLVGALIGSTFDSADFLAYLGGFAVALLCLPALCQRNAPRPGGPAF